jgi:hypothetical protein
VLTTEIGNVGGGVAYWDHVGGFAAGFVLIRGTLAYVRWQIARMQAAVEQEKAPPGFEPGMADLQSAALAAWRRGHEER